MSALEHIEKYNNVSNFSRHTHMDCEMIYVVAGEITIVSDEKRYRVQTGEICFIPSGVLHETAFNNKAYERWLLFINPWVLSKAYYSPKLQCIMMGIYRKSPIVFACKQIQPDFFGKLHEEYAGKKEFSEEIMNAELIFILSLLARNEYDEDNSISTSINLILEIQKYIQNNCNRQIRINDIAEEFYINRYYLSHIFKKYVGSSPKQFLLECRIFHAELLLKSGDMSITDIAQECGFTSTSDFGRHFRDKNGCTPKEYRKQMKFIQ